jgi:hypothetical protein
MCPSKYPLIESRSGLGYCIPRLWDRGCNFEDVRAIVDVDWDATGISTRGRQNGCIDVSRRLWRVEPELAFEDCFELLDTVMCLHCSCDWIGGDDGHL